MFEDLFIQYQKTIPEKIKNLQELVANVEAEPTLENIDLLRRAIHKLAGNAGTYGYGDVSIQCKAWESELVKELPSAYIAKLQERLSSVIQAFTKKS